MLHGLTPAVANIMAVFTFAESDNRMGDGRIQTARVSCNLHDVTDGHHKAYLCSV